MLHKQCYMDVSLLLQRAGDFLLAPWARPLLSDSSDFKEEDIYPVDGQSFARLYERIADPFAEGRLNSVAPG